MENNVFSFPEEYKWRKLYSKIFYSITKNGESYENFDLKKNFENDVFIYRPFVEECNCGYCDRLLEVYETPHEEKCATRYLYDTCLLFISLGINYETLNSLIESETKDLGIKFSLNDNLHYLCTCSWRYKVSEWEKEKHHKDGCAMLLPNFHYKKLNFEVFSRKNSVEGFIMNQNISYDTFGIIVNDVLNSLELGSVEIGKDKRFKTIN